MKTLSLLLALPLLFTVVGCEECLDGYPNNESALQSGDVKKSGMDSYGGHNSQSAILLPNGDPTTKSATTQVR
jgi:hypothetical protein